MNNIIEKLGITPIKEHETQITSFLRADIFKYDEVKELERQRNEMLETLIELHLWQGSLTSDDCSDVIYLGTRKVIERASDKSWSEIKELLV